MSIGGKSQTIPAKEEFSGSTKKGNFGLRLRGKNFFKKFILCGKICTLFFSLSQPVYFLQAPPMPKKNIQTALEKNSTPPIG
jgi:hypothetical protein